MVNGRKKGDRFERLVKNRLIEDGWFVIRQSASRFPDLIAIKSNQVVQVECKYRREYLTRSELNNMLDLFDRFNMLPVLAYVPEGVAEKNFRLENLSNHEMGLTRKNVSLPY